MRALVLATLLLLAGTAAAQDRWVAGDLHEHVTPPDSKSEVSATFSACVGMARDAGLSFVVFTPHLRDDWWRDEAKAARAVKGLAELAARCAGTRELCAIPGFEDTRRAGHVGVAFVGSAVLAAIADEHARERTRGPFLAELVSAGGLLTINHPFAGGDRRAKIAEFASDLSWKSWTKARDEDSETIEEAASCIEVWNGGLSLAEAALGAPAGERLVAKTFRKPDALALATGKRWAPVGGSDNHAFWLLPTTWVRVPRRDGPPRVEEVRDALVHGRTCAGAGPEATSLEASVAGGEWKAIGDDLAADGAPIEVRFEGEGELLLDGRSLGRFERTATVSAPKGSRHHLRLVRGDSYSGYVWIDWTRPAPRARVFR